MDGGCRRVRGDGPWELTGGWRKVIVDIGRCIVDRGMWMLIT